MDPSTIIPPSKYGDIWRFISTNFRWAFLVLVKRKWIILGAGIIAWLSAYFLTPQGQNTYGYLTFQIVSDKDTGKTLSLEEKSKYIKYVTDLYYASDTVYRSHLISSMYSTDYTIVVKVHSSNKSADSLIQNEISLLYDIAKRNLPAVLHLQKLSDNRYHARSRPLVLAIALLAGLTTAVLTVLILASLASPWLKLKKTGLPFVGYLKNYGRNNFRDGELLFITQNLLPAGAPSGRQSILFTGRYQTAFVPFLHALMPKDWKVIRLDLLSGSDVSVVGLYDYIQNNIPIKDIILHDQQGLPYICLNCPDEVTNYFALRSESKMAAFFEELKAYSIILITADPLDSFPNALALLPYASKVVVAHHAEDEAQNFYKVIRALKDNHAPGLCYLIYNVPTEHYVTEKFWL